MTSNHHRDENGRSACFSMSFLPFLFPQMLPLLGMQGRGEKQPKHQRAKGMQREKEIDKHFGWNSCVNILKCSLHKQKCWLIENASHRKGADEGGSEGKREMLLECVCKWNGQLFAFLFLLFRNENICKIISLFFLSIRFMPLNHVIWFLWIAISVCEDIWSEE